MSKAQVYQHEINLQELINEHGLLVNRIAKHIKARLPDSVLLDDLIQSGMIGLIEAAKQFDASRGASFETYAGIRVRGAILDELRKGDWIPRSVHRNSRAITQAIHDVEKELGRSAQDNEIAQHLGIDLTEYHEMLNDVRASKIMNFEDPLSTEQATTLENASTDNEPQKKMVEAKFLEAMTRGIQTLPEREALVLSLYYEEELNLREIGMVLDVSESRVSQIMTQAIHRLKAKLEPWLHEQDEE